MSCGGGECTTAVSGNAGAAGGAHGHGRRRTHLVGRVHDLVAGQQLPQVLRLLLCWRGGGAKRKVIVRNRKVRLGGRQAVREQRHGVVGRKVVGGNTGQVEPVRACSDTQQRCCALQDSRSHGRHRVVGAREGGTGQSALGHWHDAGGGNQKERKKKTRTGWTPGKKKRKRGTNVHFAQHHFASR